MSAVEGYVDRELRFRLEEMEAEERDTVQVILYDGRVIVGKLRGFDVRTNLILSDCVEREYSHEGVEMVPLGLYMIKGDNVALIGEVDEDKDGQIDYTEIKADPLGEIRH